MTLDSNVSVSRTSLKPQVTPTGDVDAGSLAFNEEVADKNFNARPPH